MVHPRKFIDASPSTLSSGARSFLQKFQCCRWGGLQEVLFAWSNWLNNISTSSHLTERGWFSRESFQKLSDTADW